MFPGMDRFHLDEIIVGKGMDVRIVDFDRTTGRIIAEAVFVQSAACYISPGQLLVFLPQKRISFSWVAHTREKQSFVLCLCSDGRKILG